MSICQLSGQAASIKVLFRSLNFCENVCENLNYCNKLLKKNYKFTNKSTIKLQIALILISTQSNCLLNSSVVEKMFLRICCLTLSFVNVSIVIAISEIVYELYFIFEYFAFKEEGLDIKYFINAT